MRDVLVYSVLRLVLFGALWWVFAHVGLNVYLAGLVAALVAMLVSILFLGRPRDRAATRWQQADERRRARRSEPRDVDADTEDAVVDGRSEREDAERDAADRDGAAAVRAPAASEDEARQQQQG